MSLWPFFWIALMVAFVVATIVAAFREKRARAEAARKAAPVVPEPDMQEPAGFEPLDEPEPAS
ncbi:MAG: hypothetical protein D6753_08715 [Planctomycetota bacterium]|nr:MAG: hypothetical protein D6753_08715 [Planctomycetota bacterium]